jgi:hypothetical protein
MASDELTSAIATLATEWNHPEECRCDDEAMDSDAPCADQIESLNYVVERLGPILAREARAGAIADLERPGSMLCDCDHEGEGGSTPTNPKNGAAMDHHCDCQAVRAAATILGAFSTTVHAAQCDHGTEFDEYYAPEAQTKPAEVRE